MNTWISVKDKLPDLYNKVLICWSGTNLKHIDISMIVDSDCDVWNWSDFNIEDKHSITHWMPLPELPLEN